MDDLLKIRDKLRSLGYDARMVNGDCFDVHQDSCIHYLSAPEAAQLASLDTPGIDLMKCQRERIGLTWWYTFKKPEVKDAGKH